MAIKPNTRAVIEYLRGVNSDVTAADLADALVLEKRQIDGIFTSALQRKGYGVRVPAEVELADGTHKQIKFLKLTDAGMTLDLDAEE